MAGRGSRGSRRDGSARRAVVPAPRQGEPSRPPAPPRAEPGAEAIAQPNPAPPKTGSPKPVPLKGAPVQPVPLKGAPAKPGPLKGAPAKPGAPKPASPKPGSSKVGASKAAPAKPSPSKPSSPKPGSPKPAPAKPSPAKPGQPGPGLAKPGLAKPASARTTVALDKVGDAGLPVDPDTAQTARAGWHLVAGGLGLAAAATAVLGGLTVAAGAVYLGWRASQLGGTGITGGIGFAAELALYLVLAGLAVCAARVNRGFVRRAPAPAGTLDVFVVSRGEPLADIDRTLRAARDITYPHRTYLLADTRIDDAAMPGGRGGWAAAALADRVDITCLTRDDGPPSRTGLLNAALAATDGDAVLLLDAGDAVGTDAAHRILGYLRDPQVGLVASAWRTAASGRGPLPDRAEPALARLVATAKDRDGAATGLGSGTLYRRVALETVGGFGAQAATEEPRTSYELHAAGWASVHHPDVVTTRAARPPAAATRLTVARAVDRLRMLLFDNPLAKTGLTTRQRAYHLADAALPLLAAAQAGLWLAPALMVLAGGRLTAGAGAFGWLVFGLPYLVTAGLFAAAITAEGAFVGRGLGSTLTGWLTAIPLSLVALVRVVVLGGRSGLAPDVTRRALLAAGRSVDTSAAAVPPADEPAPARDGVKAGAGRTGIAGASWSRAVRVWWSGRLGRPGAPLGPFGPDRWTPLLLGVSLPAVVLGATVLVAAVRPRHGHLVALLWAGGVLLLAAEAICAACALRWEIPRNPRRLRATVGAAVVLAAALTIAFG